jgi:hypothetical protein
MVFEETVLAAYSEYYKKQASTRCEHNAELLLVNPLQPNGNYM